jgi:undecaprenyl diphosphate synthase
MDRAEALTSGNAGLQLSIAASYGGRWDMTRAARRLAERVARGELAPAQIDEALLHAETCLAELPPPDLFLRTGGDQRISNFLLWQLAYSELYFTETLWPDLSREVLDEALAAYASRERRFGRTSEQLKETPQ